ncbi:MAG: hypothetical protein CVT47_02075 [Thermoplasmata archaeon HGW-Thermoplasmata-2]|nr:MAG: hypothetical protein CVT47_02075 [Thermoplasmata archaeon HGW-Thermoplasmata-2]
MEYYRHTQKAYLLLLASFPFVVWAFYVLFLKYAHPLNLILGLAFATIIFVAWQFSLLTVSVNGDAIEIRFGIGTIRKKFLLDDIESCAAVKNPWYYGWGIHRIPRGWLFNVSGFDAVEIRMKDRRRYRIGTDEPGELENVIRQRIGE